MGVRSKDPNPGKRLSAAQWFYYPVERGTRHKAFLAAHPFGVECHEDNGSKPCVAEMTDGALKCKYCGVGHESTWRGFTAIYTEHYLWRFVIITQEYKEYVSELPLGSLIRLSRGNNKHDPVVIKADPWRQLPLPPDPERSKPIDMVPSLLRCWKNADLTAWHLENPNPPLPVNPLSLPKGTPKEIAERAERKPSRGPIDSQSAMEEVKRRLAVRGQTLKELEEQRNGVHKPPDG